MEISTTTTVLPTTMFYAMKVAAVSCGKIIVSFSTSDVLISGLYLQLLAATLLLAFPISYGRNKLFKRGYFK